MVLNLKAVAGTLGVLLFFLGVALVAPMVVGLIYHEPTWWTFGATAIGSMIAGGLLWRYWGRDLEQLKIREGFAIVALAWFVLSLVGGLPFVLGGVLESYTDAFFETMSGFTTTGASILGGANTPNIEDIPASFLFWRSLAHWMGGMGIIVLTLAILPILGVGGMQLFKAEVPGPTADKLTPRVRETARRLWYIYVGITVVEILLLLPAMSPFDAINHAFATMATGGFSTRNASIAAYNSPYIEWVITVFMFLAGMNFTLHYRMLKGDALLCFRNTELRAYTGITIIATLAVALTVWAPVMNVSGLVTDAFAGYASFADAIREAAFQVISIVTTTGFAAADYEVWPTFAIGVVFVLFFIGGMAGSTGGGIKVIRHVLLFQNSFREIRQLIHPHAVIPLRVSGKVVSQDVMRNVLSFSVLYLGLVSFGTLAMSLFGLDLLSALGASLSSVGNVGPAFGSLGPVENYAHVPAMGKWFLALLMMAGRLEVFTVLILFVPSFWRR
ncbi:MAG: TrkH family potassium uptake protein [Bacteroidetes bacterium]|nr:TrkH family potassium uptake protein [Bacteroidota bacterium]